MSVEEGTLDLVGCTFLGNSATFLGNSATDDGDDIFTDDGDDIFIWSGTVNIDGCPAGFSGGAGAALDTDNDGDGTITGEAKSYSCDACVR